jgi:hypothetical protein
VLQKAGGSFTLTADTDFGATYGLKSAYYKSRGTVATAGVLRLANAESIGWRNAANGANKLLKMNASDVLEFDGTPVMLGAAATATPSRALVSDASGFVTASAVTSTELGYLSGVTSPTGSGALVLASGPTLVTPTLGVATATSINKVAITAPASAATLTLADGKTLTVSNTLTFTGTDSSSVVFGNGGTVAYQGGTLAQFASTTSAQLAGVVSDETGSGSLVFATSPTLMTPVLGVASATTINKVTLTAPASGATLTLADGKTLTVSNTLTLTGTDSSTVAFGTGGTVAYQGGTLAQFAATTSAQLAGVISDETGSGALVFATSPTLVTPVLGAATATSLAASGALTGGTVKMSGSSSGTLTHQAAATTTDHTLTWPSTQGAASTVLTNNGSGALSWGAALTTTLADGKIFIGNGSNVATAVTPAGDVTIANDGTTSIGSGVIVNADINASAAIAGSKIVTASGSTAGVVDGNAQSFAGVKTFADGIKVDDDASQSTLNYFRSGTVSTTYTFDGSGGTSGAVGLIYLRIGDYVILDISPVTATTGTGSVAFVSNTAIDTWARPANEAAFACQITNNGAGVTTMGRLEVTTAGKVNVIRDVTATAFTNSSTCGLRARTCVVYRAA